MMSLRCAIDGLLILIKIYVPISFVIISYIHFRLFRMKIRVVKKIQISLEKALPLKVSDSN